MLLESESVDSIVTDPPYELSSDGKASPELVFLEFMFPKNAKVQAEPSGSQMLPFLVSQILDLGNVGRVPAPTAPVKVGTVALNHNATRQKHEVQDVSERAVTGAESDRPADSKAQPDEYLGRFFLKLADSAACLDTLNRAGCGFLSGGLGVGFRVPSTGIPSLLRGSGVVNDGGPNVGSLDDPLAARVSALGRAENDAVARISLARGAIDAFSAPAALVLLATLQAGGAELVRASAGAGSLPAMLESRRVRIVGGSARRALSFDLIVHPQSIQSLGFMGKEWDGSKIAFDVQMWREALRVLKPGGHLLAFSGTRTYHRMVCAIEDAGFEIRDQIGWVYGSGFPKSHNLEGAWAGWGTALKPAWEPIVVARKPLIGTVAANVLQHGTGAINIDGCRVGTTGGCAASGGEVRMESQPGAIGAYGTSPAVPGLGRWPANLIRDGSDEVLACFPDTGKSSRVAVAKPYVPNGKNSVYGAGMGGGAHAGFDDVTGSAARFFYCAKASKAERNLGLSEFVKKTTSDGPAVAADNAYQRGKTERHNTHPTVKPIALMRYLLRLVTPPGGTAADPFTGSGSTAVAAALEGFEFVGFELSAEYTTIAQARVAAVTK